MSIIAPLFFLWALTALAPLLARWRGADAGPLLGLGLLIAAIVTGWIGREVPSGGTPPAYDIRWIESLDIGLRLKLDGLALIFVLIVLLIGALVLTYSAGYFRGGPTGSYYPLMVGFAAAMTTLVLADDLIVLFVAWEFTTLISYLLILRSGPHAKAAATRTLLVTVAGGLALLAAVATIVIRTGTGSLSEALAHPAWQQDPAFAGAVAALLIIAAATKAAQFPFHFWLPDAMVAPAPVSAYLHAAAMVKAGIFLLLRFADSAANSPIWQPTLITVGTISMLLGGWAAVRRTDLKEILAYSTISQLGLLVVVIGYGGSAAWIAAVVHILAHALFKAGAFLYVGLVDKSTGSRDIRDLRGLGSSMPLASAAIVLLVAAMAGVPPTFGFVSKEMMLDAAVTTPGAWLALVLTGGAVLTVIYSARIVIYTLPRAGSKPPTKVTPVSRWLVWPVVIPAAAITLLGPAPGLLNRIVSAAADSVGASETAHLVLWHGLTPALGLSALALLVGTGWSLVARRRSSDPSAPAPSGRPGAVDLVDSLQRGMIGLGARWGGIGVARRPAGHLLVPIALIGTAGLAWFVVLLTGEAPWNLGELIGRAPGAGGSGQTWIDVGLVLLTGVGIGAVVLARTALSLVLGAGIAGMGVALWFFTLGASDVALTQLLVEILTVVIMIVVIRHLPPLLPRERGRLRVGSRAALAALGGVASTIAALTLTGREEISWAGGWYITEGPEITGGDNVVNTILVDFRALDTLGELVVLALAALSIAALLDARPRRWHEPEPVVGGVAGVLAPSEPNAVFLRVSTRVLIPLMVIGSAYALLRGHNAPGGGFIAALLGAAGLAAAYLAAPSDLAGRRRWPALPIAGAGILIAGVSGVIGYLDGSFLRPLHGDLLGYHLTTALVFDVGVYLAVFGVILGALDRLGSPPSGAPPGGPPSRPAETVGGEVR